MLLLTLMSCTRKEPAFTVKGDPALTKNIKVNIELIRDTGSTLATAYYNGKSCPLDNQNTLRYAIYISYKDSLFYQTEMDNLHGKVKGESLNEIEIMQKGDSVMVAYRALKTQDPVEATALLPAMLFFANNGDKELEKQKFVAVYTKR